MVEARQHPRLAQEAAAGGLAHPLVVADCLERHITAQDRVDAGINLATISRAVEIMEDLYIEAPKNLHLLGELATTLVVAGELQQAAGESEAALASWNRTVELLTEPVVGSKFPILLDPWCRALAYVGREKEAITITEALYTGGYRTIRPWARWSDEGL